MNYVSQFLPHIASIAAPLTDLTGDAEWEWTPTHEKAFMQVKRTGNKKEFLQPLDYENPAESVYLFTDASLTGTSAWVGQGPTPESAKLAYFHSRKLTPTQTNYPTFQIETLAIVEAVSAFDNLLAGHRFTIVTNHESLTHMKKQKRLGSRQQRWVDFLSRYDFNIIYRRGKTNYLADALSRLHEGEPSPTDIYLKDPTKVYTDDESVTSNTSHYSGLVASGSSYSSWEPGDIHRIGEITYDAAAREQSEPQRTPTTEPNAEQGIITSPEWISFFTTRAQKRKQSQTLEEQSAPAGGPSFVDLVTPPPTQPPPPSPTGWVAPTMTPEEREHGSMCWTACYDEDCQIHLSEKLGAG